MYVGTHESLKANVFGRQRKELFFTYILSSSQRLCKPPGSRIQPRRDMEFRTHSDAHNVISLRLPPLDQFDAGLLQALCHA